MTDKRTRLVHAAAALAYQNGFDRTSLADIAAESEVPLGNVYYYFKKKDELGDAVVGQRLQEFELLRQGWDQAGSAKERLCACVNSVLENREDLALGGCPIGTLSSELQKPGAESSCRVDVILRRHFAWIEAQFRELGQKAHSRGMAIHLLAALQGAAVLAHSFHDPEVVVTETKRLKAWIDSI